MSWAHHCYQDDSAGTTTLLGARGTGWRGLGERGAGEMVGEAGGLWPPVPGTEPENQVAGVTEAHGVAS